MYRANIQEKLFRLASSGLDTTCSQLGASAPFWLQDVLAQSEDGTWDDFCYRETVKTLQRFSLVRLVKGRWKGVTMHGLVRWRASFEAADQEHWQWYAIFVTAFCSQMSRKADAVAFRRHVVVHLPLSNELVSYKGRVKDEGATWMMMEVGSVWDNEGRWTESEQLYEAAWKARKRMLGEEHPHTLTSMANLASTYNDQGLYDKAEELGEQVVEMYKRVLGEEHPHTLTSIANLAHCLKGLSRNLQAIDLLQKAATLSLINPGSTVACKSGLML
ncbi:hypothetical protein LTR17_006127 [Elasticomyces elasticus]|nr:hypothetical protein LTR17_006127 [Elasticomyces elasticus]